ncbi:MAG: DUF2279 domain-containing protein [Bacteroidetes bacterium]|nr:DUF2279 domain-containing protein [Bacteroidota bacterium]
MRKVFTFIAFLFSSVCFAQNDSLNKFLIVHLDSVPTILKKSDSVNPKQTFFQPAFSFNKKRTIGVITGETVIASGSLIALSQLWYKDYPQSSFHFFNDNSEWLQMDKCGHTITAYVVGKTGMRLLEWSGVKRNKAIWFGGLTGFAYQGVIEIFDGFSSQWGFSIGDISANAAGCGILIGQEYLWKEQRISLKYSFHKSTYPQYRPNLLGKNWNEQILKDYNGQTYWLSVNIASFLSDQTKFPKFLNLAFGYGADGMTGGKSNPILYNSVGNMISFERTRQYYLSMDIDLTKIKTHSPFLKTVFETIGFLKIPAPGIELKQNHLTGHWLMY